MRLSVSSLLPRRWRRRPAGIGPYKRGLVLQWHVTNRCGQRCAHCYQESYGGPELAFKGLLDALEQYKDLLRALALPEETPARGHINLTGGEPFVREDFWDLLEVIAGHGRMFSFAILCAGHGLDRAGARRLSKLGPRFVQLSVEGSPATHDAIRGHGDHARVTETLLALRKEGLRTMISFTAHAGNYREFATVAELGRRLGVDKVWTDRMIPCGSGAGLAPLDAAQTREYLEIVNQEKVRAERAFFGSTQIAADRALQFLTAGGMPYRCHAGESLLTIMPDGALLPCRRMPEPVGNITETPLKTLYAQSPFLRALRQKDRVSEGCRGCLYQRFCAGGLKCMSWAASGGDPFRADPGCPLAGTGAEETTMIL